MLRPAWPVLWALVLGLAWARLLPGTSAWIWASGALIVGAVGVRIAPSRPTGALVALWVGAACLGALRQASLPRAHPPQGVHTIEVRLTEPPQRGRARAWLAGAAPGSPVRLTPGPVRIRGKLCGGEGDRLRLSARALQPGPARFWGGRSDRARWTGQGIDAVWTQVGSRCRIVERAHGLARLRRRVRRSIRSTLEPEPASVVAALALGDRAVEPGLRSAFNATGLAHLLVVSGFHLALVAALVGAVLEWSLRRTQVAARYGAPRWAGRVLVPALALYTLWVGAGPSALRAWVMVSLQRLAPQLGRSPDPLTALGAGAVGLLLYEPRWLEQNGFRLSVAAVWGVTWLGPRLRGRWDDGRGRRLAQVLAPSLGATLATAPLVASSFGRVSGLGILATPIAAPWVCFVLVPTAGVASVLEVLHGPGSQLLWRLAGWEAEVWVQCVRWAARVPGASVHLTHLQALCVAAAPAVLWFARGRRAPWLAVWLAAIAVVPRFERPGQIRWTVLPVGHGSAALLTTPSGHAALFDTGTEGAARAVVLPHLRWAGVRHLNLLVTSHPDADHDGGLGTIMDAISVDQVWRGGSARSPPAGTHIQVGPVQVRVVASWWNGPTDNDRSLVVEASASGCRVLLPGDLEAPGEARAVAQGSLAPVDAVLVPHHGSATSSTDAFISALQPRWAVVSTGGRHRPARRVLDRYRHRGITVLRTDRSGAVRFECADGGPMQVETKLRTRGVL